MSTTTKKAKKYVLLEMSNDGWVLCLTNKKQPSENETMKKRGDDSQIIASSRRMMGRYTAGTCLEFYTKDGRVNLVSQNAGCSTIGFIQVRPDVADIIKRMSPDLPIQELYLKASKEAARENLKKKANERAPVKAAQKAAKATSDLKDRPPWRP